MGLKFFDWLLGRNGQPTTCEITCADLMAAAEDFQVRQLCFWTCVNMVANAVGRCEVKTFRKREEVMDREYYLWNFEPNANQNSTAFFHKLIGKLYMDNEALIISSRRRDGNDAVLVADSWQQATDYASRMNEYTGVQVGDTSYDKTFRERFLLLSNSLIDRMRNEVPGFNDALARRWAELRAGELSEQAVDARISRMEDTLAGYMDWERALLNPPEGTPRHDEAVAEFRRVAKLRLAQMDALFGKAPAATAPEP